MLKFVLMNRRGQKACIFLILLLICATFTLRHLQSETDALTPLEKAEKLIITGNYYKALLVLKPLLISDEKSEAQEQALWIAHQLGDKVTGIIDSEASAIYRHMIDEGNDIVSARQAEDKTYMEKVNPINEFGADIVDCEMAGRYYDKGFLQRLIDKYPNSPKRPIAEYHLIYNGWGMPEDGDVDKALKVLYAYVEKYEKTGRFEVYKAYLDIAQFHHGLWAALTYPDEPGPGGNMGDGITSEDPEKDKKRAAAHKAEALKYYALYHINPYGLPYDDSYDRLKKNEAFGWHFITWGC